MIKIGEEEYNDIIKREDCLVVFSAEWCGACKMLAANFALLEQQLFQINIGLYRVDIDEESVLCDRLKVNFIPHVVLIKNGKEAESFVGAKKPEEILAFLNNHVGK